MNSSINHEQDRQLKRDSEVTRYMSSLIFDDEDFQTTVQLRQSLSPCHCSTSLLGAPYHGTTDGLRCDEISNSSNYIDEKKRSASLLRSGVEFQNSSLDKGEEGLNNSKNDQSLDPFKPPTEEQLQKVLNTLADDVSRLWEKYFYK